MLVRKKRVYIILSVILTTSIITGCNRNTNGSTYESLPCACAPEEEGY